MVYVHEFDVVSADDYDNENRLMITQSLVIPDISKSNTNTTHFIN